MATFSLQEKITKAKIQLLKEAPFFAHLALHMSIKENNEATQTMGVYADGRAVYNAEFVDSLSDSELKGVICHETMHVALQHLLRSGKRDHKLFTIAADIIINYMLQLEGFDFPEGALLPTTKQGSLFSLKGKRGPIEIDARNKSAEEVYEYLLHNAEKLDMPTIELGQFDDHEYSQLSDSEKEAVAKEWKGKLVDAATAAKSVGKLPGAVSKMMDDLLNPKFNWKSLLYQYLTKDILYNFTYKRPGRRSYATGFYMPFEIKENLNITCTVDCSGSISRKEYTDFMSEIIGIANAFTQINMDILFWDTEVRQVEKVTRNNQKNLLEMEIPGGGGTYMSCIKKHFENKQPPQLMVHLTDGYIEHDPELSFNKHLFVVSERGDTGIVENYGTVFKIHGDS